MITIIMVYTGHGWSLIFLPRFVFPKQGNIYGVDNFGRKEKRLYRREQNVRQKQHIKRVFCSSLSF